MFDFAWSEIAVLGVIALVVIGPKDLPKALKTAGFAVRRARMMAREFQNSVDDMIRDSELQEIRETAAKAAGVDLKQAVNDAIDPGGEIRAAMAEPLGGTLAQEAPPPAPAVEGSAIGELPPPEATPSILNPKIVPPQAAAEPVAVEAEPKAKPRARSKKAKPVETEQPDEPISPDMNRNPSAP
jgi:sec-independent protein translocase protein TatB